MRILLIDDDAIGNFICRKIFEHLGFNGQLDITTYARDAIQLLEKLAATSREQFPSLIMLDLNMPLMNGFEFLEYYQDRGWHQSFSQTGIIMLSSSIFPKDERRSRSFPAVVDYFTKPLSIEKIHKAIAYSCSDRLRRVWASSPAAPVYHCAAKGPPNEPYPGQN
ncbi:MAG: response regulator [Bacteroidetes bacterium]|nr:MAG: response regulator [Bacteroidota bacterium]